MINILLADDDQVLLDLYKLKFTKLGFNITAVSLGSELLEKLEAQKPDIVISDRRLDDADGLELLGKVRLTDHGKTLPLILMTNMEPKPEDMEQIKQLSPAEYIMKEKVDLTELGAHIKELLQK